MPSLRLTNLSHEFDERIVFRSINACFSGKCLAVSGPNGSGKSTLLRILSGLLTPTGGSATFSIRGNDIARSALREFVGLAAPEIHLYSDLSPRENLAVLARMRGPDASGSRVSEILERFGLADRADDPVGELSSGFYRRACLAAALLHEPAVLLLDEPSLSLDAGGISLLRSAVEAQMERGMVILATNDPAEADSAEMRLDLGAAS